MEDKCTAWRTGNLERTSFHMVINKDEMEALNSCIRDSGMDALSLVLELYKPTRNFEYVPKVQRLIDAATNISTQRHGEHPADKLELSAHEASHGLVGHLVGFEVGDIQVWAEINPLRGMVDFAHTGKKNESIEMALWKDALVSVAGFVGEKAINQLHPTSSVHEKIRGLIITGWLDEKSKDPPGSHFERALGFCEEVLHTNREVFDEMRFQLLNTGRISKADAVSFLANVKLVPLPALHSQEGDK